MSSSATTLVRQAINAKHMESQDHYPKVRLRAHSQSRTTWENLTTIKNPQVMVYIRQANIAHGSQQESNAPTVSNKASRAKKSEAQKQTIGGEG